MPLPFSVSLFHRKIVSSACESEVWTDLNCMWWCILFYGCILITYYYILCVFFSKVKEKKMETNEKKSWKEASNKRGLTVYANTFRYSSIFEYHLRVSIGAIGIVLFYVVFLVKKRRVHICLIFGYQNVCFRFKSNNKQNWKSRLATHIMRNATNRKRFNDHTI